jgi:GTP cyclohydrolase FolE2
MQNQKRGKKLEKKGFLKRRKISTSKASLCYCSSSLQQKMRSCERKEATELARKIPRKTHQRRHAAHGN